MGSDGEQMGSERRLATWGWKCLRGAGDDLCLMTQPASPETLENHALFGKIGLLKEDAEGQSSAWRCYKKGMERQL